MQTSWDEEAALDERDSLREIYVDDELTIDGDEIALVVLASPSVTLRLILPSDYPSGVPVFLLESDSGVVTDEVRERINTGLGEVMKNECCIYHHRLVEVWMWTCEFGHVC